LRLSIERSEINRIYEGERYGQRRALSGRGRNIFLADDVGSPAIEVDGKN
tara:strand:+ start:185 stop:334 length:150 start_codon:yes stop_codon:yes gene_type:complete